MGRIIAALPSFLFLCFYIASPVDGWIPWRIQERLWFKQGDLISYIATDCITGATFSFTLTACFLIGYLLASC